MTNVQGPQYPHAELTRRIIGAAMEVHRQLGPGLTESAYEICLAHEFHLQSIQFEHQKSLVIEYKGVKLECEYRFDFLVEGCVIVELKAVESLLPIHEAQLLTYMKITHCQVGLLINFNVPILKQGIKRRVL